jgi:hypothetical protein
MIVDAHPRDLIIALDPLVLFLFYACLCVGQIVVGGNSPIAHAQGGDAAL